jgi:hypothetical protein
MNSNAMPLGEKMRLWDTGFMDDDAKVDNADNGDTGGDTAIAVGNTAYNLDEINPNEIISGSQDEGENSRLPASSQADYSVSKNDLAPCTEDQNCHLPLNYQNLLAANSPSNSTMPSQEESLDSDFLSISDTSEQFEMPENNAAVNSYVDNVVNKLLSGFRSTIQCQFSQGGSGDSGQCTTQAATTGS